MKSRYLAMLIVPGSILAGLSAMATTPPQIASGASPAPSAASATSAAKPPRPAPTVPLETLTIPQEASPRPTIEEWKTAEHIRVTRRSAEGRACETYRVREWFKVKCTKNLAVVKQHGGNTNDVFFWIGPNNSSDWAYVNGGEVMFRMRPGDHRVFEFFQMFPDMCYGQQSWPWVIVDETWVEGEAKPTVVIR